jgi:hypothetical protein
MASEHAKISYIKSFFRIGGYLFLYAVDHHPVIYVAATLLILAEVLGIVEEFGH